MTESEADRRNRSLKELEGKNIAHYSVMLSSYVSSRTDANKAIFVFSTGAIGFLMTSCEILSLNQLNMFLFYLLSMASFVVAVISTLFIHISNASLIEAYIRNDKEKEKHFLLKNWAHVNYIAFGLGITFASIIGVIRAYG